MILPTRHLAIEASLVSIGARLLRELEHPLNAGDLWERMRDQSGVVTFDRHCLALTLLYVLGLIDSDGPTLYRSESQHD